VITAQIPDMYGPKGMAIGRQALEAMGEHKIAPTPQNYEVWLGYFAGATPDLKIQIDRMIAAKEPFTNAINEALYDRFFGGSRLSAQMAYASDRIAKEVSDVVRTLQSAGDAHSSFGAELTIVTGQLERGLDADGLRNLVAGLARATKEIAVSNQQLSARLEDSGRELAQLRETLSLARAEALSDGLTALANRKNFDLTLRRRIDEALGGKTDLCLMMCDIDFFKRFNDAWGHHTGDQVIRFVASTLQKNMLGDFLAARYGGEEFAMIMPRTSMESAKVAVETIRQQVESKNLVRKSTGEALGRITISCGIASLRQSDTPTTLIERADQLLFVSKRAGRNRVTSETDAARLAVA
jgi:diguanylate cyclase